MVESKQYNLDHIFQALADPTRRAMLRSLSRKEKGITEVAKPFDMSLAAVSKHVRVLERAKLVKRRREGSYSFLSINGEAMRNADQWIEFYRRFWDDSLESLKNFLEKENS